MDTRENLGSIQRDELLQGLIDNGALRVAVATVTDVVREVQRRHNMDPLATIATGRAIACVAAMGSTLKQEGEFIRCIFSGDGPLKQIVAEFVSRNSLRGYVAEPQVADVLEAGAALPNSVAEALGKGEMVIRRGVHGLVEPYTGVAELTSSEIASDIANYFVVSEQIPTSVAAGVKLSSEGEVLGAGAVIVQKLGGVDVSEDLLRSVEERLEKDLKLSERIAAGASAIDIYHLLLGESHEDQAFDLRNLEFRCFCSRGKMVAGMRSLGTAEVEASVNENGTIDTICHYCRESYSFLPGEIFSELH